MAMRLLLLAALLITLPALSDAKRPAEVLGAWSEPVGGLRGRLVATPHKDAKGRAQLSIELELENARDQPIEVSWVDPNEMVRFTLTETSGAVVPEQHPGGNSPWGPPVRKAIAPRKSHRVSISKGIYEYLALDRVMLRPLAFQGWFLASGRHTLSLRAVFTSNGGPQGGRPAWAGRLDLPGIAIVTP